MLLFLLFSCKTFLFCFIDRFLLPSYSFSIDENNPIGHHIGQVQAVDDDVNYNAVFYDISNMMYSSFFQISSTNGSITAKRSLDREKASSYIFTVEAFNKDQYGNASLMSFVEVSVCSLNHSLYLLNI